MASGPSERRKAVCVTIERSLIETVTQLGMNDAVFKVSINPLNEPGRDGTDRIVFLFSANKGIPPAELSKIASGGEAVEADVGCKIADLINKLATHDNFR